MSESMIPNMKKKPLGILIALAFIGSSLSIPAFAAVKAGATCKTKGQVKTDSGFKYTCTKSGKKFVWSKGIKATASAWPSISAGGTCFTVGVSVKNSQGYLECRQIAGGKLIYFQLSKDPQPVLGQKSPEDINTCRVADQRSTKNIGGAITYPPMPTSGLFGSPSKGIHKVAVIPIDFSDNPGNVNPESIIKPFVASTNEWTQHFSNGKLKFDFQISKKWIRASKPSTQYVWLHPGQRATSRLGPYTPPTGIIYRDANLIAEDLMADAQNFYDYTDLNTVFFVYPTNIKNIWDSMTTFARVKTNKGDLPIQITATSQWTNQDSIPNLLTFIHEGMHPMGLAGHAPYDGSPFSIMSTDSGSVVLNAWDASILDWQGEDQIYCVSKENLEKTIVSISPIDRKNLGMKAIFIKINKHTVLVVESRRKDYWSSKQSGINGFPDGFYGLVAYRIDTRIDKNRVGWNQPVPNGIGGFADFIVNPSLGHREIRMFNSPPLSGNVMLYQGESHLFEEIKITLLKSGDNDTVQIERLK
jgi:hypothetical protein